MSITSIGENKMKSLSFLLIAMLTVATSCYRDESIESPVKTQTPSTDPLDILIQTNFVEKYGVAVRYKFVDRYVDQNKRVAPARRELVEPMLDFLTNFWIDPYINVQNGRRFFENHVPGEIIFIGSPIFNSGEDYTDGSKQH
jgi:hypothetical protein